jgi:hypothetical protein
MFLKKSAHDIMRDASIYIYENSPVRNFSAGSIARSITEAMAPEIGSGSDSNRTSLYDFAQQVLDEGFISKATGLQLEMIGGLFSYPKRMEQVRQEDGGLVEQPISDDLYRYEITQVVPSMATANYSALRLALLSIQGVKDIVGEEYSFGTGSFTFLLIPQYGFDEETVKTEMEAAIEKTKSYGIKPGIITLEKVPVDLTIKLLFHETTTGVQKDAIRFEVQNKLTDYIGLHERGQAFIYNDLVQEIMNAHEKIIDFEILRFSLNNEPVLLTNQTIANDERLIPQYIQVI